MILSLWMRKLEVWQSVQVVTILRRETSIGQQAGGSCSGGILALRAHCALLLDYVPPEEPLGTTIGNALRIR